MKTRHSLYALWMALMTTLSSSAQHVERSFYIDFGQKNVANQGYLTNTDTNGNTWNNLHGKGTSAPDKAYALTSTPLVTSDGSATSCSIMLGTTFSTNGYSNGGLQAPKKELLGDLAIESATQDYIFMENAQDFGVIHLRGLQTDKAYRFHSFGSRTSTDERSAYLTFSGENTWTGSLQMGGTAIGDGGYNGNNNNVLVSEPIFPDRDGHITLTISKKVSGAMVYLNCMKIEELSELSRPNQDLTLSQTVYVDFGETSNSTRGHQTSGADINGHYWNNITSGSSSSNAIPAKTTILKNSENKSSSIWFTTTGTQYTNGIEAGGNNSPSAQWLGDLAIQTATEDYMFIDNGDCRPFTLKHLNKDNCYRLYIYGTRNHTDNRITNYVIEGQTIWKGGQCTSGYNIGGENSNGNLANILVTDYLYPDRLGQLVVKFQRLTGMAHISALKVEEYTGGTRPADPLVLTELRLTGNAEDVVFQSVGMNTYRAYARLQLGTFHLSGIAQDGQVELSSTAGGLFEVPGAGQQPEPFRVDKDCVARITVDANSQSVEILPITMHVRGDMGAGNPEIQYKGQGVWESEVTLAETSSQQWVDKHMYFALNNSDALAIRRLRGASSRYALGMAADGQDVEDIYQNAGTYTITVDLVKMTYNICAPIDEYRISVFGSSVANGQGATDYKGYRYLYGQHLINRYKNGLSPYPFYTTNVSIGGNTTQNLLDRYDDLIRDFGRYVIFGLSLGNEGIHGSSNQEGVFAQWRDNMLKLIRKVRADGKIPVVMNNYTRGDYDDSDYSYVKRLNLLIHEWDVPSFNCLGAIDKGNGQWADGYVSDTYHQNTAGHYEFYYAMVPSLFDALKEGKPLPKRNTGKQMTLAADTTLLFTPEGIVHPFTISLRIKGGQGQVLRYSTSRGEGRIVVNADGTVTATLPTGATITSKNTLSDSDWTYITLTTYYAQKRTKLYVGSTCAGTLSVQLGQLNDVTIGGSQRTISEVAFWRSAMTPEEIEAHCNGKMLKSSLELYVPLGGKHDMTNQAQSTNSLQLQPAEGTDTGITAPGTPLASTSPAIYNLAGQRLSKTTRGVNIIEGKLLLQK